ncbi:MAG: NAD(P)H-hydrate dehydratase [Candidatus Latescibacter sp.]|nr:NAD(P)H-hydrate dehydratase [Candidatus Latescibacter sp.]
MKVFTGEQMAEIDRRSIEWGKPGIELMRAAGKAVCEFMAEVYSDLFDKRVVVLAGKGNNGGDGFRVAELLRLSGIPADVFLIGRKREVRGDALACLGALEKTGGKVEEIHGQEDLGLFIERIESADVIVDALFGTGLRGEITGLAAAVVELVNHAHAEVVAVDIPSGVNSNTGQVSEAAVQADYTVTFGFLKAGMVIKPGRFFCGSIQAADIGFPLEVSDMIAPFAHTLSRSEAAALIPVRPYDAHKNSAGKVFILSGSVGMTGAPALCAASAMRSGAGLVRVGCPESLSDILAVKLTEIMNLPLPEVRKKRCLSLRALGKIREAVENMDAVAVGPGLGTYYETSELVRRFLDEYRGKVILDADGINAYRNNRAALTKTPCDMVLTPHAGELSRLMEKPAAEIMTDPIGAAKQAAAELGKIVLLKGPTTVTVNPAGEVWLNPTGNQALATAGAGDVLTGTITGLAAQGLDLFPAAVLGAFVHGLAGEMASEEMGIRGVMAGDVLENLSQAFDEIEAETIFDL